MPPEETNLTKIKFESEQYGASARPGNSFQSQRPKTIGRIIKYSGGLIKTENQANILLVGCILLIVAVSVFIVSSAKLSESKPTPKLLREVKEFMIVNPPPQKSN